MKAIGILAYGSLITDPGEEIEPLIVDRIPRIQTPFSVEFARTTYKRDWAPTLVPVEDGGMPVSATILVLRSGTTIGHAKNVLWRREACKIGSRQRYNPPENPTINTVMIEQVPSFAGLDAVLYTKIGANIEDLSADKLAELAIESAKANAGKHCRDGISYLAGMKREGISTPLMASFETAILRKSGAPSLHEAWSWYRGEGA